MKYSETKGVPSIAYPFPAPSKQEQLTTTSFSARGMSIDVIDDNDDTRSINSTSSSDFAANMLNVADPFDAGDPDTRVQRYASLKDFDFLPRELQIITDGGPGKSLK